MRVSVIVGAACCLLVLIHTGLKSNLRNAEWKQEIQEELYKQIKMQCQIAKLLGVKRGRVKLQGITVSTQAWVRR